MFTKDDHKFMLLALKLASKGLGSVEPNPAVGAVIVKDGNIIGKGFHKRFGNPHAEIEAIADCGKKGFTPAGATVYVTLEPCCHWGKTGPCTDTLIKAKVKKVVAAVKDPSQHAAGKGLTQLRKAGIEVQVGLLERKAIDLNRPFFKFSSTARPWVILKWAQSLDGKLAYAKPDAHHRWISNELSRKDVHDLRRRVGAILVGINTVLADDPMLTPRPPKGKRPLRVVLDSDLKIPLNSKLVKTAKKSAVLVFTAQAALKHNKDKAEKLYEAGVTCLATGVNNGMLNISAVVKILGQMGVQQILVEGGPAILGSFVQKKLVDELRIYIAPKTLYKKGTASITGVLKNIEKLKGFTQVQADHFAGDLRISAIRFKRQEKV